MGERALDTRTPQSLVGTIHRSIKVGWLVVLGMCAPGWLSCCCRGGGYCVCPTRPHLPAVYDTTRPSSGSSSSCALTHRSSLSRAGASWLRPKVNLSSNSQRGTKQQQQQQQQHRSVNFVHIFTSNARRSISMSVARANAAPLLPRRTRTASTSRSLCISLSCKGVSCAHESSPLVSSAST